MIIENNNNHIYNCNSKLHTAFFKEAYDIGMCSWFVICFFDIKLCKFRWSQFSSYKMVGYTAHIVSAFSVENLSWLVEASSNKAVPQPVSHAKFAMPCLIEHSQSLPVYWLQHTYVFQINIFVSYTLFFLSTLYAFRSKAPKVDTKTPKTDKMLQINK